MVRIHLSAAILVVLMLVCSGSVDASGWRKPGAGSCSGPGCVMLSAIGGDEESLGLLQQRASGRIAAQAPAHKEPTPGIVPTNVTDMWWQVVGAVDIEESQAALAKVTDGEEAKQLQAKLDELRMHTPFAEQVKELYSDQWDLMKYVVAMDRLSHRIHVAEENGSPEVEELLKQVETMRAKLPADLDEEALVRRAAAAVPNVTAVWWQVAGAADIEETQAALAKATDGEEAKQLQAKLDELRLQTPFAEQVKEVFSDQWDLMKYVVAMDKLSHRIHVAEENGSPEVEELLKQVETMRAKLPADLDEDALIRRAAAAWIVAHAPANAAKPSFARSPQ